ncbi:MAG TPA: hypothetical protein VGS22_06315 [Thermoanaerobaculia bacterium]|jgi:hypothetical protein|nr:hypothetical protein [Thermoanaerobaculia bacterium]
MSTTERFGWLVLFGLLAAVLFGAATFSRAGRPSLVGDEATYAMQAASLAFDLDLRYTRADYDRFVRDWGGAPDGLILQSRTSSAPAKPGASRALTYGKPVAYALFVAPFVRAAPVRGPLIANALALALASWLAARSLRLRIGPIAPLWAAVFVFASVSFAYAFWVHADLFLFAAVAAGFAVAYGGQERRRDDPMPEIYQGEETTPARRTFWRFFAAGLLLAIPGSFRPFYLVLLLPAALAVPKSKRAAGLAGLALGALLLLGGAGALQLSAGGSFTGYGGERQGFYPRTGYPEVDFPASDWERSIRKWGNTSWTQEGAITPSPDLRLWGWNTVYLALGQNIGVLPYFLPLVLGLFAFSGERGRWAIPLAVAIAALCFLAIRPFNFYGGGGAIGNRYFLPLYPALWFLAGRSPRGRNGPFVAVLITAAAAPFLWPLWTHPRAFPIAPDGRYAHTSLIARALLPYETTQSHIPGGQDLSAHGLWIKFLEGPTGQRNGRPYVEGDGKAEILFGSPKALRAVLVDLAPNAPSTLEVSGGTLGEKILRPDGGIAYFVNLSSPRAVHPMWWTDDPWSLYRLSLRLPGGKGRIAFDVEPAEEVGGEEQKGPIVIHRRRAKAGVSGRFQAPVTVALREP